ADHRYRDSADHGIATAATRDRVGRGGVRRRRRRAGAAVVGPRGRGSVGDCGGVARTAMNASFDVLFEIAWRFASLSLLAIGGINALLPEFHRIVVDVEGWMTSAEFADLFALAQLAPGPNAMVVSLLG